MWKYKNCMTASDVYEFVNSSNVDVKRSVFNDNRYIVFYTIME